MHYQETDYAALITIMIAEPLCFRLDQALYSQVMVQEHSRQQSWSWLPPDNQKINEKISSTNTLNCQTLNMFRSTEKRKYYLLLAAEFSI